MAHALQLKYKQIDKHIEKYMQHNPVMAYFMMLIGIPALLLLAVTVCTTLFILPFALLFGWV